MPLPRVILAVAVLALETLAASTASALTVSIARPASPTPVLSETLVRLQGELLSVGFDVHVDDAADAPAPGAGAESLAAIEVVALIRAAEEAGQLVVDVWVPDKNADRYLTARVAIDPEVPNAAEKLAIRALEALRSGLSEARILMTWAAPAGSARPPTESAVVPALPPSPKAPASGGVGVEAGAAALTSLNGLGPAVLPVVGVDWAPASAFVAQLSLAGLGSASVASTPAGDVHVTQQYGLVGGAYRLSVGSWLWPYVGLGAGVMHTSVEGLPAMPDEGHSAERWSLLADANVGAMLRLHRHFTLDFAAHVQVADPYITIHVLSNVVATSGYPNLVFTLTLGAWL